MSGYNLFSPKTAGTVSIAATTSSAAVALGSAGKVIRIYNADATNIAFVEFGGSGVTASASASMPIGPGQVAGITRAESVTHVAAITGSSTATVYFTPGDGA